MSGETTAVADVRDNRALIDGDWTSSSDVLPIHSPYDGRLVARLHQTDVASVRAAIASANDSWRSWAEVPAHERADLLHRLASLMQEQATELARTITLETGKTLNEALAEVRRSIATIVISAEESKRISGEVIPMDAVSPGVGKLGFTIRVPIGVVAAITPFNAPLNSICHKLGPALAAGNVLVLKPHPHGSGVAVMVAQLCLDAGIPHGTFNIVHGGPAVGEALTTDASVSLVNFTGSGAVADKIIRAVGIKKVILELGGNAPTIVHSDADLSRAAGKCLEAAFGLAGQSCISTQRILVHEDVHDEFLDRFVSAASTMKVGDPLDPETRVGPLISPEAADRIEQWVSEAIADGAEVRCGGSRRGTLFEPTVLTNVNATMKVVCDEVFGPVVTISPYKDFSDALLMANATPFGLKAGVFTASLALAMRCARELEYGTVNINDASRARLDHEPSGGVKQSGWGREGPRYAIEEMTYLKMVSISH